MGKFKRAKDIKVGAIGYGAAFEMGRAHLNEMKKAGMTPTAVCDIDVSRLPVAEKDFPGIETYDSIGAMLKQSAVDLVTVITPHNVHTENVLQCLRAGRHVVVEKPMAIETAECDAMIREAKKRRLLLSTYHNRHWDGCILGAMKQIRLGALGEVVRVEIHMGGREAPRDWWRASKSISGGILYDWGVHLIEYALQAIDSKITEVSGFLHGGYWAKASRYGKDVTEDEGQIVARFASGAWLTLNMSSLDATPGRRWVEIVGTEGAYSFSMRDWQLATKKGDRLTVTEGPNPASEGWRFYQNVADHLVKREKLVITPEWARRPIHIIDLACRSAAQGRALKAKYQ